MEKIYVIGDADTVTAFRLGGVEGAVTAPDPASVGGAFAGLAGRPDAGVILITREMAEHAGDGILDWNLNRVKPVIVEIPGIHDERGLGKSLMSYITEALGISI